jgi:hypothetical protein
MPSRSRGNPRPSGGGRKPAPRPAVVAAAVKRGDKGQPVKEVQQFLKAFGYLGVEEAGFPLAGPQLTALGATLPAGSVATAGEFDDATATALRQFQRFHGLPVTGEVDDATRGEMSRPRCGVPDLLPRSAGALNFVAPGQKWPTTNLTYVFEGGLNPVGGLTADDIRGAVQAALDMWSEATPLKFTEKPGVPAHLKISFAAGNHGDGFPFDGPGNVLAHAFFPTDGRVHFDLGETWGVQFEAAKIDLVTVAAHEIGHALGLDHSQVRGSLMFPTYSGVQRFLDTDDIRGIQTLYP